MASSSAWAAMSGLNVHKAIFLIPSEARLAQSAERKALNLVVVGLSPTVGAMQRSVMDSIELHDADTYVDRMLGAGAVGGMQSESELPWPNGQGVGLLIRRLRVRVPQGVHWCINPMCCHVTARAHSLVRLLT